MSILARFLDRLTTTVEEADVLDAPAESLDSFVSRLPAGKVKDLLSGTDIGHPLHPVLVTVPIGAFSAVVLLDALRGDARAAQRLLTVGLVASVPAAAAGLVDWSDTRGAERRVGMAHLACNSVGLSLLTGSLLLRRRRSRAGDLGASDTGLGAVLLAGAGMGVIGISSWLGGHLTYAMGVGVDTTAFQKPPTEWTDAVGVSELVEGQPVAVTVESTPVLLVRLAGEVLGLGDRCTHRGAPLHEGVVERGCIVCPWHDSIFDLRDGSVVQGPATRPAPVFETRVVGDRVQVRRNESRTLRLHPTA